MESGGLVLFLTLAGVSPASASHLPGFIESLLLSANKHPALWGLYVFTIGLPVILFISFMWPDVRFGPPDQQYYYKKSDDVQPDDDPDTPQHTQTPENQGSVKRVLTRRRETLAGQKDD